MKLKNEEKHHKKYELNTPAATTATEPLLPTCRVTDKYHKSVPDSLCETFPHHLGLCTLTWFERRRDDIQHQLTCVGIRPKKAFFSQLAQFQSPHLHIHRYLYLK